MSKAYPENGKYIFVSYSHEDSKKVFETINELQERGAHIWYDEGIKPSSEWVEELAQKIKNASFFLLFISNKSIKSEYVKKEIHYAVKNQRRILACELEKVEYPEWLDFLISSSQSINTQTADYIEKIFNAFPSDCKTQQLNSISKPIQPIATNTNQPTPPYKTGDIFNYKTNFELLNTLFNKNYKGWMKCVYSLTSKYCIWFIRLDGKDKNGWRDTYNQKDTIIEEFVGDINDKPSNFNEYKTNSEYRAVFQIKDEPHKPRKYVFIGLYKYISQESTEIRRIFRKFSDTAYLVEKDILNT